MLISRLRELLRRDRPSTPIDPPVDERLRAQEARHAASIAAALDCIVSMDHVGRVTEWNPAAERTFGYARDEALGAELAMLIVPPALRDAHRRGLAHYLATGEGTVVNRRFEITAARRDGSEFPVELSITRLPSSGPAAFTGYLRDLTEQKRAEQARRLGDLRFQRLVEQSPISIQIFAPDGTVRQVNGAWERLWGITLADLPGYNILDDPQLAALGAAPLFRRAFAGEAVTIEPIPYVLSFGARAGQVRWVGAFVYAVRDEAGAVNEVVLAHEDVTDRRAAQDALRDSEQRLRALVEQSAAGIALTDLTGRITYANDRYCQLVGYAPDEVTGLSVQQLTHPDDRGETEHLVAGGAATGREYTMEKRYVRKDGATVWVAVRASVMKDEVGRPQSIMGVVVDVSDRKRAEAALRESEDRLRLAIAIAEIGTFDIHLASDAVTVNEAGRAIYGWPAGEPLTFARVRSHFHPDDRDRVVDAVAAALAPGGAGEFAVEQRIVRADGATRWIRVRGRALYDHGVTSRGGETGGGSGGENDGAAVRCVGTYLDITDQREAERHREQLMLAERQARIEAERASKMKDEFLATLSHELRTPLSAILGWSQVLRRGTPKPQTLAEGLATIERNARAQTQIIEDLLDMSRIISGKLALDARRIDLATPVRAAIDTVRPAAVAKDVTISFDAHDGARLPVLGDLNRLQQVFWNLLSNAIKFTPRGGVVAVRVAREQAHWQVEVADTGEGVPAEFLPYVFDRFRQADASTTRRHGGLGLGLSIVKQLVELHGGGVGVRSAGPGQGSTFTVALPVATPDDDSLAAPPAGGGGAARERAPGVDAAAAEPFALADLGGLRVLVVDDEADARALVRQLLEDCGAVVATASTAAEALAMLRADRPDVLVSDIGMPGDDGYTLIRNVRALDPAAGGDVPAIALTAYARAEDRIRSIRAGYQLHVPKPVEPAELITMIATLVGR